MLLVGWQEGHPACKKYGGDGGGGHWSVWMELCPAGWSVCLPLLIFQQQFYGPLSGTTRVSRYQKKHSPTHHPDHHTSFISFFHLPRIPNNHHFPTIIFWILMVQGKITEVDTATVQLGATPSELISEPSPSSPHFCAGCPSCRNPPNLSWLGTGTGICWIAYPVAWFC